MTRSNLVDLTVELVHETAAAWKVSDGGDPVWIPKSAAELELNESGRAWTLTCPRPFAEEKGLL